MKKFTFILFLSLFMIFFKYSTISAKSGTCIFKQQNTTHQIDTPFYWYEVTKESLFSDTLQNTINYTHTFTLIETKEQCNSLNNASPTYTQPLYNNYLNNRTINYYFNIDLLTNSEEIFNKSIEKFLVPDLVNTSGFTITTTYISFDDLPPVIANDTINSAIIAYVNEKFDVNEIKKKITAYDENDGIIEIKIQEDNYSINYNKLGTYAIIFSATDNSGNTSTLTINIKIIDNIAPTIKGQKNLNSYMSNPLTIEQIKETLTITDNYDTNLKTLTLKEDNYSSNKQKEGNFTISFFATDNSNNKSDVYTITIKTTDDIAPTIKGSSSYTIDIKNQLDISIITNQLTITDNIDTNPTLEIASNTYTSNYFKVGIYQISFISKDKNNNETPPFIVNIVTKDNDKPLFYVSQKFIGVDSSNEIKIEDLINLITEINNINNDEIKNIKILENNYNKNYNIEGTHSVKLECEKNDNSKIILQSNIVVSSYKKEENKNTPKKTFWSVIKDLFNKFINFIKKLFKYLKELI